MSAYKITPSTSVFKNSDSAFQSDSAGADSLTVDAGAFLISSKTGAVLLANTGAWTVTINGSVYSESSSGVSLSAGNSGISKFTIGADGLVGGDSVGMRLMSSATVVNKGTISGDTGILLGGAVNAITNSGSFGVFSRIEISAASTTKITNTGRMGDIYDSSHASALVITNSGKAGEIISDSSQDQVVTNSGIIDRISLGGGDDKVTNSGVIIDSVFLNGGDNILINSGTISDHVSLGGVKNVVTNSGQIVNGINFGSSIDVVTNSGDIGGGKLDLNGGDDIFKNTSKLGVEIDLGTGNDQFTGGNAVEILHDNSGTDKSSLGGGNDKYYVTAVVDDGSDTIDAGSGVDSYDATGAGVGVNINLDTIAHNFGPFIPSLTLAASTALQGAAKDIIKNFENAIGSAFDDHIAGSAAVNNLFGGDGWDILFGFGGNDVLGGDEGSDRLIGGAGRDRLDGGAGGDFYIFEKTGDSLNTARDFIADFDDGSDVIDLTAIDANTKNGSAINDAFVYIGNNKSFTGVAGEFRSYWTPGGQMLEGDTNGDGKPDFAIEVYDPGQDLTWSAVHNLHL